MILVRNIRLPLSAGEPQAFEKALHAARIPRGKVQHLGVAKLSVDARHGQPKLVYTVAVTLKEPAEEAALQPAVVMLLCSRRWIFRCRMAFSHWHIGLWCAALARRACLQRCCWPGRAISPLCWSAARRWTSA